MREQYKFFWKGPLSNWYLCDFVVDGITFNCGEQYMMYIKAILFNDTATAAEIIAEKEPKNHKFLGRKISGFKSDVWDKYKYELVKKGLFARFSQDSFSKSKLLENKGKTFVEASPYDKIWGIGYDVENAIENLNDWGQNLLGKILTELSNEIE